MPPRILLLEDEALVAQDIMDKLNKLRFELVGHVESGEDAVSEAQHLQPDVVLLDISVKGMNGIEAGRKISGELDIPIIYLTRLTSDDTFDLAKETAPCAFLDKPVELVALKRGIELAVKSVDRNSNTTKPRAIKDIIFLPTRDSGERKILLDDIYYLQADHVYCDLHFKDNKKVTVTKALKHTLQAIQDASDKARFMRIHKSYAVNANHVTQRSGHRLKVLDQWLDVSPLYRPELQRLFHNA